MQAPNPPSRLPAIYAIDEKLDTGTIQQLTLRPNQHRGARRCALRAAGSAALTASSEHATMLDGALQSEDTEVMIDSLRRLGFLVDTGGRQMRCGRRRPDGSYSIGR